MLKNLRKEREVASALEGRWADFRKEIKGFFENQPVVENLDDEEDLGKCVPPEISAVLRNFLSLSKKVKQLEGDKAFAESQMDSSQRHVKRLEQQLKDSNADRNRFKTEKMEADMKAKDLDVALREVKAREKIGQREADSLRSLLQTYANTEEGGFKKVGEKITSFPIDKSAEFKVIEKSPTVQGLQLGLNSARAQILSMEDEAVRLRQSIEAAREETKACKAEHERVLEKFGKLRDALLREREKAEKAEERAVLAETLVGKGHFNDESTRALHLKENPMIQAVRHKFENEIKGLKINLEEKDAELALLRGVSDASATKSPSSLGTISSSGGKLSSLDAQKLHKRLKESFKEQIGLFREGVYLLTGYKIDMYSDSDRPRFRVRSVFSDREDDHLTFLWPKAKRGQEGAIAGLDLLDTEMAQVLSLSPSFDYMTKYNSMPAFMASVQLGLFEKLTFVG